MVIVVWITVILLPILVVVYGNVGIVYLLLCCCVKDVNGRYWYQLSSAVCSPPRTLKYPVLSLPG